MSRHDVVVVGGGHNGLACAAYLARAGLRVLVCERRHIVGGPCAEYEYFPGYRASITNSPGSLELGIERPPRIVNISIDYLRPCLLEDTFARGVIIRQGRRVANVRVEAWQSDPDRLVAAAHAHFLLPGD